MTVSEASARDLQSEYGIASERMRVVGNGINLDVFHPLPGIARRTDRLITTLSADSPLKGFPLPARGARDAARDAAVARAQGDRRARHALADRASCVERLGLRDVVHFTGRVEAEDIARAYAESTVAVVPSLYEGFGFPGRRGDGVRGADRVDHRRRAARGRRSRRRAGLLVEPRLRATALARGDRASCSTQPELRREMGIAGRARVEALFTWRKAAERTVDVLPRDHARAGAAVLTMRLRQARPQAG